MFQLAGPLTMAFSVKDIHLYLDPGSGSILIQVAIAAILGLGIFARLQWSRIKKWFGRKPAAPGDEENEQDE